MDKLNLYSFKPDDIQKKDILGEKEKRAVKTWCGRNIVVKFFKLLLGTKEGNHIRTILNAYEDAVDAKTRALREAKLKELATPPKITKPTKTKEEI